MKTQTEITGVKKVHDWPAVTYLEMDTVNHEQHLTEKGVFAILVGRTHKEFIAGSVFEGHDYDWETAEEARQRAIDNGHELYYAYADCVCISNTPEKKRSIPAYNFGDVVTFHGKRFKLTPSANMNVELVEC